MSHSDNNATMKQERVTAVGSMPWLEQARNALKDGGYKEQFLAGAVEGFEEVIQHLERSGNTSSAITQKLKAAREDLAQARREAAYAKGVLNAMETAQRLCSNTDIRRGVEQKPKR